MPTFERVRVLVLFLIFPSDVAQSEIGESVHRIIRLVPGGSSQQQREKLRYPLLDRGERGSG